MFGCAVSGISDVNGDARGDLAVGTRRSAKSPSDTGPAYIFDGSSGMLLHTLVGSNEEFTFFGSKLSGACDVNGDGRGDVIVGAESEADGGRAYIFDGSSGALLQTLVSHYEQEGGAFGGAVSGIPDANGDGLGDVVVGAIEEHPGLGFEHSGRAYVFYSPFGQTAGILPADLNQDSKVNCKDLIEFLRQFRGHEKEEGMGSADFNTDGSIDDWDLFLFEWHWAADGLW